MRLLAAAISGGVAEPVNPGYPHTRVPFGAHREKVHALHLRRAPAFFQTRSITINAFHSGSAIISFRQEPYTGANRN
jgi:hypothetical protein